MKKYAVIDNSKPLYTIWFATGNLPENSTETYVEIPQNIDEKDLIQNYVYDNAWIKRPETLPEYYVIKNNQWVDGRDLIQLKENKIKELKEKRFEEETSNLNAFGKIFQFDLLSQTRLNIAIQKALIAKIENKSFEIEWKTLDNSYILLTRDMLIELNQIISERLNTIFNKYELLLNAIKNSSLNSEIDSIKWN